MNLTPIKIPGKRTRDGTKAAVLFRKLLNPNRPRGRPLKLTPSEQDGKISVPTLKATMKRTMKNIKSRRKMSNLEKLPTELLEKVYLFCLNVDLPRSSPIIAGKLTSERIYTRTIMAAFDPTWEVCYGKRRTFRKLEPEGPGDVKLQSSILSCRWMSLPLLIKVHDDWARRYSLDRQVEIVYFDVTQCPEAEKELEALGRRKPPSEYFEEDFAAFSTLTKTNHFPRTHIHPWDTYVGVADGLEIPHHLLTGPWTEEMTRYLYWLAKNGARLEWITSISGELALAGLNNAVSVGDLRVMHLLLWIGLADKVGLESLLWALHNSSGNRLAVMELLMRFSRTRLSVPEVRRFRTVLEEFRDNAHLASEQANVSFVADLDRSQLLFY